MDPISIQNATAAGWNRPAPAVAADLGAVLREGRMIAGDVVQQFGGGSVLVSFGRQRVPARSQTELQTGRRYVFEVVRQGEALELRVVSEVDTGDAALLRALRGVLGSDRPLGSMLQQLLRELTSSRGAVGEAADALEHLAQSVRERVFEPGEDAAELANKLRSNGTSYEGRWARAALAHVPPALLERTAQDLAHTLVAQWTELDGQGVPAFQEALRGALRELFATAGASVDEAWQRWSSGGRAGDLPMRAEALLERALERWPDAAQRAALTLKLRALGIEELPRALRIALVGALAGVNGMPPNAAGEPFAALAVDLKAELLRTLGELEPGPARQAIERALANLEAEQLVNVARHSAFESSHWSVPLPDGSRWTTAHLYVHRDASRNGATGVGDPEQQRLSIAVEFTRTGPLHADVLLKRDALSVRVLASNDEVVERLRSALPELEQLLAFGGRAVHLAVAVVPEADLRTEDGVRDSRYLSEHHVMDVIG